MTGDRSTSKPACCLDLVPRYAPTHRVVSTDIVLRPGDALLRCAHVPTERLFVVQGNVSAEIMEVANKGLSICVTRL